MVLEIFFLYPGIPHGLSHQTRAFKSELESNLKCYISTLVKLSFCKYHGSSSRQQGSTYYPRGGGPGEITDSGSLKCLDLVCFGDKINPILTYPFNDLMEIRKRSIKVKHSRGVFICQ